MTNICEYLGCHGESTITDIAEAIDADRHTVSKELQVLEQQGRVTCRQRGPAKLWRLTNNPFVELLDSDSKATTSLKSVLDSLSGEVTIQDTERDLVWPSDQDEQPRKCYEYHVDRTEPCPKCPIDDVIETGETQTIHTTSDDKTTTLRLIPIKDDNDNVTNIAEHMIQW
jgi:DNA-binding MarR family transcriptional regulator